MISNWIVGTSGETTSTRGGGRKDDDDTRSLLQRRPNHSPRVILGMALVCVILSTIDRMHGNEPNVATSMNKNMMKQTPQSSSSPVEGYYYLEEKDEFYFENGDIIGDITMMRSEMEHTKSSTTTRISLFSETLKDIENKLVIRNMIKHFVDNVLFSSLSNDNHTSPEQQQQITNRRRRLNEAEVATTTTTQEEATTDGGEHSVAASEGATSHSSEISPEEEHEQELSIETDFWSLYRALVFLICIYVAGQLALLVGMPSLFGEIVIGFLMGPPLANFVPYAPSFVLIGEIGLIMLLLEAGIDIDVAQLKVTGVRAILIAFTGAFGALAVGIGLSYAMGVTQWQACIALGASFSPTSLAVASNALSSGKVLNTPVGQLIVASCVIDDVIGLVILSLLEVLIEEEAQIHQYFMPLISAVVFLGGLGYVAIIWMPRWVERFIYKKLPEAWHTPVCFTLMIVLLMAYMPLMYISKASYLTGAFLAGLSFSQIPPIHHAFVHYTANLFAWLLRVFFSSSIGFQVPIKFYKDASIVGWGFAFYVAVLAKLPLGLYSPRFTKTIPKGYPFDPYWRDVFLTGIAMTSRGEFSFIIASFAISSNLATPEQYAAVVWAVLLSCATSPFMLLSTIRYYNNLLSGLSDDIEEMEVPKDRKVPLYMSIQARTGVIWGLRDKLDRAVDELGLITIDHRSWHPRGLHATVVTEIYVQDSQVMLTVPLEEELEKAGTISSSSERSDKVPEQGTDNKEDGIAGENVVPDHAIPTDQEKAENEMVAARCEEVRVALLNALGADAVGSEIQVSEWRPAKFMRRHDLRKSTTVEEDYTNGGGGGDGGAGGAGAGATTTGEDDFTLDEEQAAYVKQQVQRQLEHKELIDTNLELYPTQEEREKKLRTKTISGPIAPPSNTERFMLQLDNIGEEQQQPEGTDGGGAAAGTTTATKPTPSTASGMERPTSAATFSGGIMSHPGVGGRTVSTPTGVSSFADGTTRPPASTVSATNGFVGGTTSVEQQQQQQQLLHQQRVAARRMQRQKQVSTPYTAKRSMWDTDEVAQQAALQGAEATAAVVSSPSTTIMDIESGSPSYGTGGARLRQRRTKPQRRKMQSDFFMDRIREEMPTIEERLGGIVRQEITYDEQTGEPMEGSRRQLQQQRQRQSSLTNLFRPNSPKQS